MNFRINKSQINVSEFTTTMDRLDTFERVYSTRVSEETNYQEFPEWKSYMKSVKKLKLWISHAC